MADVKPETEPTVAVDAAVPGTGIPGAQSPIPAVAELATKGPTAPAAEPTPDAPAVAPEPTRAPSNETAPAAPAATGDSKSPATKEQNPLAQLWATAKSIDHPEIWGVTLADPETHIPSQIVLQKYLNANDGDLAKAKDQLAKTLEWRAKTKPLELIQKQFPKSKFEGLGYVTTYRNDENETNSDPENKEVFTWNIYGGVKSIDETFGDLTL